MVHLIRQFQPVDCKHGSFVPSELFIFNERDSFRFSFNHLCLLVEYLPIDKWPEVSLYRSQVSVYIAPESVMPTTVLLILLIGRNKFFAMIQ